MIAARLKPIARIVAVVLATLGAAPATAAPSPPPRIIAVGDLHGDYKAWQDIARAAGIVDAAGHWSGGNVTLVQLGDILDRGADSLKIVRSLQQLAGEAPRRGGRVYVVLGNHEAMNLIGDDRYVTPGEYAAFVDGQSAARRDRVYEINRGRLEATARAQSPAATQAEIRAKWFADHPLGWVEHRQAWGPSGDLGRWATRNPAILKLGDTLFVHGGLSAETARQPLAAVNALIAKAMAAGDDGPTSALTDPLGPLWYRGLIIADSDAQAARAAAKPPTPALTPDAEIAQVLAAYGAKRMVVGHTPSLKGIVITPDQRLARIDTGISRYYGGPLSWLEILGDRFIPHTTARTP